MICTCMLDTFPPYSPPSPPSSSPSVSHSLTWHKPSPAGHSRTRWCPCFSCTPVFRQLSAASHLSRCHTTHQDAKSGSGRCRRSAPGGHLSNPEQEDVTWNVHLQTLQSCATASAYTEAVQYACQCMVAFWCAHTHTTHTCSLTSGTTLSQSFLSSARAEHAATNQQFPRAPWLRSVLLSPSTISLGLSHISCKVRRNYAPGQWVCTHAFICMYFRV